MFLLQSRLFFLVLSTSLHKASLALFKSLTGLGLLENTLGGLSPLRRYFYLSHLESRPNKCQVKKVFAGVPQMLKTNSQLHQVSPIELSVQSFPTSCQCTLRTPKHRHSTLGFYCMMISSEMYYY